MQTNLPQSQSRQNNFNIIRILAAFLVFVGHMSEVLVIDVPALGPFPLHMLGVCMLFTMGGYLIAKSYLADSNLLRYLLKRFFRLWPPFAVMILLLAFGLGPLLTTLSENDYYNHEFFPIFLGNLRFRISYLLPGVFTNIPIQDVNGSLWTMPVEAALYIITPILLTLLRAKKQSRASFCLTAVFAAAVCAFDLYLREYYLHTKVVFYATDWLAGYHLAVFYVLGILFSYPQMRRILNLQAACLGLCLMFMAQIMHPNFQQLLLFIVLPYFVFSFAFAPIPLFARFGSKVDLAYSVYLYGFVCQQLMVYVGQKYQLKWGYVTYLLLSAALTLAVAWVSFMLVERPSQRLVKKILQQWPAPKRAR